MYIDEASKINITLRISGVCQNKCYDEIKNTIEKFKKELEKLNVRVE